MSGLKKGFTLIEVALFLVITGALFAAITVGVQNSISQQKFNDAVQNFAEFLRNAYAETMNVQNLAYGRSNKAIYGKLISFGEDKDFSGETINTNDSKNVVYMYDVVGDIGDIGTGNVLETLVKLNADVIMVKDNEVKPASMIENYTPKWTSQIEPACNDSGCDYNPFKGAVLIVRHPRSGTVYTFVMEDKAISVGGSIAAAQEDYELALTQLSSEDEDERIAAQGVIDDIISGLKGTNVLKENIEEGNFEMAALDFCVNPEFDVEYSNRRDVRIVSGARNASGVEIIDDNGSKCVRKE